MTAPVYYDSASIYIDCASDLRGKITRIDAIITALEDAALVAAAKGDITEYSLDDGQTKIRTVYRDASSIATAIANFEQIKQRYINRLNGRHVRLVDGKNFR
jgi:2C-methyl-D-erythritol 2,4-cyclodiphosphate synthase